MWGSDGGAYYDPNLSVLGIRKDFNRKVFNVNSNIWEEYQNYIKKECNYVHYRNYVEKYENIIFEMMPTTFLDKEEFVSWLRDNEEKIIKTIQKLSYKK